MPYIFVRHFVLLSERIISMTDLKKKLSNLPLCPGVYIMKDKEDKVIYVG